MLGPDQLEAAGCGRRAGGVAIVLEDRAPLPDSEPPLAVTLPVAATGSDTGSGGTREQGRSGPALRLRHFPVGGQPPSLAVSPAAAGRARRAPYSR